jgi:hypothetical protein
MKSKIDIAIELQIEASDRAKALTDNTPCSHKRKQRTGKEFSDWVKECNARGEKEMHCPKCKKYMFESEF